MNSSVLPSIIWKTRWLGRRTKYLIFFLSYFKVSKVELMGHRKALLKGEKKADIGNEVHVPEPRKLLWMLLVKVCWLKWPKYMWKKLLRKPKLWITCDYNMPIYSLKKWFSSVVKKKDQISNFNQNSIILIFGSSHRCLVCILSNSLKNLFKCALNWAL